MARLVQVTVEGLEAFDHPVELDLQRSVVALVGPNATGKSTLLRILSSILGWLLKDAPESKTGKMFSGFSEWRRAVLRFEPTEIEFLELEDVMVSVEIELQTKNGSTQIRRLQLNDETLALSPDATSIYSDPDSNEVAAIEQELAEAKRQSKHPKPEVSQPAAKRVVELKEQRTAMDVATLQFEDAQRPADWLARLLEELHVPRVRFVQNREELGARRDQFLKEMMMVKRGPSRDEAEFRAERRRLEELLEQEVEIHQQDEPEPQFSVDGVHYGSLSAGTQVCVDYFALTHSLDADDLLVWDEPENGLHASRRCEMLRRMKDGAHSVLLATHATEFSPIFDESVAVYRCNRDTHADIPRLRVQRVPGRAGGFALLDSLGVRPSTTLFASDVVIWVEGPSDLLFWRFVLRGDNRTKQLVEGFDYSFLIYGGSNLKSLDVVDEPEAADFFDLLSIAGFSFVVADSDRETEGDALKPRVQKLKAQIIEHESERVGFEATFGRELENYLPAKAIRHSVQLLSPLDEKETRLLEDRDFELGRFDQYEEVIASALVGKGITLNKKPPNEATTPKGRSNWGDKIRFMSEALGVSGLANKDLQHGAEDMVDAIIGWIEDHRRRPRRG